MHQRTKPLCNDNPAINARTPSSPMEFPCKNSSCIFICLKYLITFVYNLGFQVHINIVVSDKK